MSVFGETCFVLPEHVEAASAFITTGRLRLQYVGTNMTSLAMCLFSQITTGITSSFITTSDKTLLSAFFGSRLSDKNRLMRLVFITTLNAKYYIDINFNLVESERTYVEPIKYDVEMHNGTAIQVDVNKNKARCRKGHKTITLRNLVTITPHAGVDLSNLLGDSVLFLSPSGDSFREAFVTKSTLSEHYQVTRTDSSSDWTTLRVHNIEVHTLKEATFCQLCH
jgi:hypothetical protein